MSLFKSAVGSIGRAFRNISANRINAATVPKEYRYDTNGITSTTRRMGLGATHFNFPNPRPMDLTQSCKKFDRLHIIDQLRGVFAQRARRIAYFNGCISPFGQNQSFNLFINKFGQKHFDVLPNVLKNYNHGWRYRLPVSGLSNVAFAAVLFNWDQEGFSEENIKSTIDDVSSLKGDRVKELPREFYKEGWEKVIDRPHLVAWRKPISDTHLHIYKIFGSYHDVRARSFYECQTDLEFRASWDRLVIVLEVIDRDLRTDSEVVRWASYFPWPMSPREYIYIRKCIEHPDYLAIMSQAVKNPPWPVEKNWVRVTTYTSNMVIRPHSTLDEPGFDYVLTYSDDPQTSFPGGCQKWLASTGVPDFVGKLHDSAKRYEELKAKQKADPDTSGNVAM